MPGILTICATPIGNLGDVSPRLIEVLGAADVIFAEDTRRTSILLTHLGIDKPLRSFFVGNEGIRSTEVARRLEEGENVALVSDAGTPVVADPGLSAVRAAVEVGATVTVVPGPSAVTAALAVSGFGGDRFVFEGFVPRRGEDRTRRLTEVAAEQRPVVMFSAPRRLADDLTDLAALTGGERKVCVARELTKHFEEVWWGTMSEAVTEWSGRDVKGEVTVVIDGAPAVEMPLTDAAEEASALVASGMSRSEAARTVAKSSGRKRREIYDAIG